MWATRIGAQVGSQRCNLTITAEYRSTKTKMLLSAVWGQGWKWREGYRNTQLTPYLTIGIQEKKYSNDGRHCVCNYVELYLCNYA